MSEGVTTLLERWRAADQEEKEKIIENMSGYPLSLFLRKLTIEEKEKFTAKRSERKAQNVIDQLSEATPEEIYKKYNSLHGDIKQLIKATPEGRRIYEIYKEHAPRIKAEQEAARERENFKKVIDDIYALADYYEAVAGYIRRIKPLFEAMNNKKLTISIKNRLEAYDDNAANYRYYDTDSRLAIYCHISGGIESPIYIFEARKDEIKKGSYTTITPERKLNAAAILEELEAKAIAHEEEAAEARRKVLELPELINKFKKAEQEARYISDSVKFATTRNRHASSIINKYAGKYFTMSAIY